MKTYGIEKIGICHPKSVLRNAAVPCLVEAALRRGEGSLSSTGALVVTTGKYTGRSPDDKFIVDSVGVHKTISWGNVNRPIEREKFNALWEKAANFLNGKEVFIFDGFAGADKNYAKKFRIINELASQNLFIRQLLIRPTEDELSSFGEPDFTLLCVPGFFCEPETDGVRSEAAIIIDYEAKKMLIAGSGYAGEIKKSVFSVMNYIMPGLNVLPMHCSANMDPKTHETALFFGLSGTGKTTLSADSSRKLIGDDEHGWSPDGVFNFEGGCYAKCIHLKAEDEPEIYGAVRFGSVVENVVMNKETRSLDFDDETLTVNTRVGYPISYIPNSQIPGTGGIPKVVIFLTADAFGVLPPVSRLDKNTAMYHFVTGFTSKVAGTERGITKPIPTFSTLFGEPFMPMDPAVYAKMLGEKLEKYGAKVYLVNTGWAGGSAADGAKRIKLSYTRAMISGVLSGAIENAKFKHHDIFNVDYPLSCPGVPSEMLDARSLWKDKAAYDAEANKLASLFAENFAKKYPNMPREIASAGPAPK